MILPTDFSLSNNAVFETSISMCHLFYGTQQREECVRSEKCCFQYVINSKSRINIVFYPARNQLLGANIERVYFTTNFFRLFLFIFLQKVQNSPICLVANGIININIDICHFKIIVHVPKAKINIRFGYPGFISCNTCPTMARPVGR